MPEPGIYEIIDKHIHRIARIAGEIVQEKTEYLAKMNAHIKDLVEARKEVLELIEKLDNKQKGGDI